MIIETFIALALVATAAWSIRIGRRAKGKLPAGALVDRDPAALNPFRRDLLVLKILLGCVLLGVVVLVVASLCN